MEQKKQSVAATIGYFFFSWVPLLCFIMIQLLVGIAGMMIVAAIQLIPYLNHMKTFTSAELLMKEIMDVYMSHVMVISVVYQIIGLIIFSIWYYFYNGRKKIISPTKVFTPRSILGITVLGVSIEFLLNGVLTIVQIFFPKIMEAYQKLMEEAGIDEVSVVVMLATIIMAPLVEELVFRGVTFQIAFKIKHSFWIANFIQALAFGIGHMNLVQGCYAFCLGIVMGCVLKKYRSIYATILLHAVFNFSGTVLTGLFGMLPMATNVMFNALIMMLAACGTYLGYIIIHKDCIKNEMN